MNTKILTQMAGILLVLILIAYYATLTSAATPIPVLSFSGRVTDAITGQGIGGALVEIRRADCSSYQRLRWLPECWDYSAITAPDGGYVIFDLPAGDYVVRASAPDYAREYWDNVTPSDEATAISVLAGSTISGIDFALIEDGSIAGHIYLADGTTPVANTRVLVRPSKYRFDDGLWVTTDAEGVYQIEGLSLGNYRVTAEAPGYARLRYYDGDLGVYDWLNAADVVVVPPVTTANIDITLYPGASIAGHVYQPDGVTPVAGALITASAVDSPYPTLEGIHAHTNDQGYYIIEDVRPGIFTISAGDAQTLARRWYDSRPDPCSADPLSVNAGETLTEIDIVLEMAAPVRGHVYDVTGEPLSNLSNLAVIANRVTCESEGVAHQPTDSSGAYTLWVGSGDYYLSVWGEAVDYVVPEWYNNAYRLEDAETIHVEAPNEVSEINFYLVRAGSISGTVYEADGTTPIPSASVYAFPTTGNHPGAGANTNPDGTYTIAGLPSGVYRVQATISDHAAEYFNDSSEEASATGVQVNPPSDTPGIDFLLALAPK